MLSRQLRTVSSRAVASRSSSVITVPAFRTYAQATSDSKPPVALYGLDGTYASALYTAAVKTSALETTSKSLTALSEVFKKDSRLPSTLNAPTLTPGDKSQIVQELQRHMGGQDKGDTVKNFLQTLADNNRLGILQGVLIYGKVNPDIKGGLIVEIGDRTIDLSVSAKIAKMNKLLTDTL
ncbi:hypothetical protein P7C71_g895, partial [Lecanoromycetidae sp. Uapishka_2]